MIDMEILKSARKLSEAGMPWDQIEAFLQIREEITVNGNRAMLEHMQLLRSAGFTADQAMVILKGAEEAGGVLH